MLVIFTDFGLDGPYIGQVKAVLHDLAPGVPQIDLLSDAPAFDAQSGAYLLAAYGTALLPPCVVLAVIDPGVGGDRAAVIVEADRRWYVGPDNGVLALVARRAAASRVWRATWQPPALSASFHGRDLFAPLAARLAAGEQPPSDAQLADLTVGTDWPDDLDRVVYVDRFGNLITGRRAAMVAPGCRLHCGPRRLTRARTFSDAAIGQAFWYENANGLAEIAVNQGRADRALGLSVGDPVTFEPPAQGRTDAE